MKLLIVNSHQEKMSFNAALVEKSLSVLKELGHEIKLSDLYAMKFDPVAGRKDFPELGETDYINYMLEQQKASASGAFSQDIKTEQEKLKWADTVIIHFPIWWFSVPAILKGWFDRVFAAGITWDFGRIYEQALLRGKRAMLVVTTGGPEEFYSKKGAHGTTIDEVLYTVNHGTLYFCGMDVLPPFVGFSVFQVGEEGRKQYLAKYEERLRNLEKLTPIKYPSMG
jgi:NAD(P)H dehydrogenase (quinone)